MKARLIKRGEITQQNNLQVMRQSGHSQLEAQALALTGIAAVRAEVQTRMTTRWQERAQARKNFNALRSSESEVRGLAPRQKTARDKE